jgi:bifunctional UDP-N-acetylglucosamine pyrophosphorylase/glucosamine-1-phosphate N-acetyltransferase
MSNLQNTAAVILAAGKGSRMQAKSKNKVAFVLGGKPMIQRTRDNLVQAGIGQLVAVVGFAAGSVKAALGDQVTYVTQTEQKGTGDALKAALPCLASNITTVLSVYGDDSAFYPPSLYQDMVQRLEDSSAALLFLTITKEDPTGLGRIVRGEDGEVTRIVEEKNATEAERQITEINTGFYCFKRKFLDEHIGEITKNELSGEYYLTDMVAIALEHGLAVTTYQADSSIWHGVNNRSDYAKALAKVKSR